MPPLAPLPHGNSAHAFAFDPHRPNVVYAESPHARGGVYVFKSTDDGAHWSPTGARGQGWKSDILSLTYDPRHAGTLFAGTDTAVYKTVNGGRTWLPFRRGLFPRPHKPACSTPGLVRCWKYQYYGTPGKTNWNRNNGWVLDIAVDPRHRDVVYAATNSVRKSTDGGHTWKRVFKPHWKWSSISRIETAPTKPESIYAIAHSDNKGATAIYKSTDAGRTWQVTGGSHPNLPPSCCADSEDALAIDPANPQTLYADVGNTVLTTVNGGASWLPMANGLPANVTSLAADPRRSGTLYASTAYTANKADNGIYKTTNGGQTWTEIWSGFGIDNVAVDPTRPSTIYASGGDAALLRSTDRGSTWTVTG